MAEILPACYSEGLCIPVSKNVKGFVRNRMRESRTYGSVRGEYRKVSVYSIVEVKNRKKFNSLIPELTVVDLEQTKKFYIDILHFSVEYERQEDKSC